MDYESRTRRVLIVTQFLDPTMGYISNYLPKYLIRAGANVAILAPSYVEEGLLKKREMELSLRDKEFTLYRDRETEILYFLVEFRIFSIGHIAKSFSKVVESFLPDVVQSLVITSDIINLQIAALQNKYDFDFYLQDHSSKSAFFPNWRGKLWHLFLKLILSPFLNRRINGCFYPSPDILEVVVKHYGIKKHLMIYQPLGTNRELFHYPSDDELTIASDKRRELGIPQNSILFLYAGRLTFSKGTDFLLKSFVKLNRTNPRTWLLLVGKLKEPEIFQEYAEQNNILLVDQVPAEELRYFYWFSDFGIWPKEGSTSIIDAISCGLPVILRSGITEPERKSHPSLTFEEENWQSLANVMKFAAEQVKSANRNEFLAIGRELIEGWDNLAKIRISKYYFGEERH